MHSGFKRKGAGIHSNIDQIYRAALKAGRVNTDSLLAGEKHIPLYINGKFVSANFAGPGTHVEERLRRGDKPLTETDKISLAHDLRYSLATSGQQISTADRMMVNKLGTVTDHAFNKYPSKLAIGAKYHAEKLFGTKYPNKADLANNPDKDNTFLKNKLSELEQEGYGIDPAAHLKLKLMKIKPLRDRERVRGTSRMPDVNPSIRQYGSKTIDNVDYSRSEPIGSGLRVSGGDDCDCMSGSGLRVSGGFAFLLPFIPFLVKLGTAFAIGAAGAAGTASVNAIVNRKKGRGLKGGGLKEIKDALISKLKKVGITIKDFSKSALAKMEAFAKDHATADNAMEVVKFLKPFVLAAIRAKLNSEVEKYEASLYDDFDFEFEDDDIMGSGVQIPIKESTVSDSAALKIFNQTVDKSKLQDGEGLRLAGAPSGLYKGRGNKKTLTLIMSLIKKSPELANSREWINEQATKLDNKGVEILNSYLIKNKSSIHV
jgi:hypothetical protein